MSLLYHGVLRPALFSMDPETAHNVAIASLQTAANLPGALHAFRKRLGRIAPSLCTRVFGIDFASPVGVAAGFDKSAQVYNALAGLGFGFVEVGTITPKPQGGNPKPRIFRLPEDRALINRLGFNNCGARLARQRLERERVLPVGVNIGKNRDTPDEKAMEDYLQCAEVLAPVADYLVVNVSSPNTPGLRKLQSPETLAPLLEAVRACANQSAKRHVPLLVKIAPDLDDQDVDAIADLATAMSLDGIVACNTTVSREGLRDPRHEHFGSGGVSGAPLKTHRRRILQRLQGRLGKNVPRIAVGGVETPEDVRHCLQDGASLVQVYTAFVYQGPALPARLNRSLSSASPT